MATPAMSSSAGRINRWVGQNGSARKGRSVAAHLWLEEAEAVFGNRTYFQGQSGDFEAENSLLV